VVALVGGQYGSEGKGSIAHYLADEFAVHVRSGGPNAGHTFSYLGKKWPMQQVPVGWTNPVGRLILTPGALVSLEVLKREMDAIRAFEQTMMETKQMTLREPIEQRIWLDTHAGIISPEHRDEAGGVHGEAHRRYGSTGEGVGVARIARLQRNTLMFERAENMLDSEPWLEPILRPNTAGFLADAVRSGGMPILLEGTQGTGLSVIHGTWPFTTNHDTNAAQMAADAGLAPQHVSSVIVVFRTCPIRVAGNSGPMKGEVDWATMQRMTGIKDLVEFTTVTRKPRRIGAWDGDLAKQAIDLNAPDGLAVTFLDYLFPDAAGVTTWADLCDNHPKAAEWVSKMEHHLGVRIWFVGTGPDILIDRRPSMQRPDRWNHDAWVSSLRRRGRLDLPKTATA
jgi:adenylosuccinate synthase